MHFLSNNLVQVNSVDAFKNGKDKFLMNTIETYKHVCLHPCFTTGLGNPLSSSIGELSVSYKTTKS